VDADPVSLFDAQILQGIGQSQDQLAKLPEGHGFSFVKKGRFVGMGIGGDLQDIMYEQTRISKRCGHFIVIMFMPVSIVHRWFFLSS